MNVKEFTLQKGFPLPVLKALDIIEKPATFEELTNTMITKKFFTPTESDLENIDFNGKIRFQNVVEIVINNLLAKGFIVVSNNLYKITEEGKKQLNKGWGSYLQTNYIKKVDINNNNKYIYFNMPSYLLHNSHKQSSITMISSDSSQNVKLLNDLVDYIDSNYPSIEEMVKFLKSTYNLKDNSECLNIINILRGASLLKVIGKNLCLTKLGQWYINSYSNIVLFRILANKYIGFEEIFNIVSSNKNVTVNSLKHLLMSVYGFDWVDTEQLDIRLIWLENAEIIKISDSKMNLLGSSEEFAIYLGLLGSDSSTSLKMSSDESSETPEPIVIHPQAMALSTELDEIIDDLVSESVSLNGEVLKSDESLVGEPISSPQEIFTKNINLSEQERDFLLNNIDFDNTVFSETADVAAVNKESDDYINIDIEKDAPQKHSVVIPIPTKHTDSEDVLNSIFYIHPEEISALINLSNDITSKIASALNMGKHIILTGPHGTGKTSIAVILAKIAAKKLLNQGYILTSANNNWDTKDTIGTLIDTDNGKKVFKEGFMLKSIREDKWLIIDEINNCDTKVCFDELINSLYGHNTILSYMHENYKNIEILSEPDSDLTESHQYIKNKNWRIIATIDSTEKQKLNFSSDLIRRFAFIDISSNNYVHLIDEYFTKYKLHNDLLKTKIKTIFSENGLLKYNIGASSIHDLIQYISIRNDLITQEETMQDILAEGLELYILPQLRILDESTAKEAQSYLLGVFDGYDNIKRHLSKAL